MILILLNHKSLRLFTQLVLYFFILFIYLLSSFIYPIHAVNQTYGLKAEYFNTLNFSGTSYIRVDNNINFNWGENQPNSSTNTEEFSVRWTGQIKPRFSETYTFYTTTDDGVRLWVNDQLIIDKWQLQSATSHSGVITLKAGVKYNLKMEFYDNHFDAVAKLLWKSPSTSKQIVPRTSLFPSYSSPEPLLSPIPTTTPSLSPSPTLEPSPTATPSPSPSPTIKPSPTPSPTVVPSPASSPNYINAFLTFYGWDNSLTPGNQMAYPKMYGYPTIHDGSGGVGSYSDPVTMASDPTEWAIGSISYIPFLQKYVIMEDFCESCSNSWKSSKLYHVDVWMDSNSTPTGAIDCMGTWTKTSIPVEVNPPNNRTVNAAPLFDLSTGLCRTPPN